MIVYDVTDENSFKHVGKWLEQIKIHGARDRETPMVLVGNKTDLSSKRVVDKWRGEELAKNLGIPYIETSAKNSTGVDQAFDAMLDQVVKAQNYMESEYNTKKKTTGGVIIGPGAGTTIANSSTCNC